LTRFRAAATAAILFLGITGSMGTLGALIFEETVPMAAYGGGLAAGAGWLSYGTYRSSRGAASAGQTSPGRSRD
jgi:hypothetical protein